MSSKIIQLRYPSACSRCGLALPAATRAFWDASAQKITCLGCIDGSIAGDDANPPGRPELQRWEYDRRPNAGKLRSTSDGVAWPES